MSHQSQQTPPVRHHKKLLLIAIGLLVLVIAIVVYLAITNPSVFQRLTGTKESPSSSQTSAGNPDQKPNVLSETDKVIGDATTSLLNGNYEEGQQKLQSYADKRTGDKLTLAIIYLNMAGNAQDAKKYDEALGYAQKAEVAYPDYVSMQALGDISLAKGDKPAAIKYYKVMLERFPEDKKTSMPFEYEFAQSKLKEAQS